MNRCLYKEADGCSITAMDTFLTLIPYLPRENTYCREKGLPRRLFSRVCRKAAQAVSDLDLLHAKEDTFDVKLTRTYDRKHALNNKATF